MKLFKGLNKVVSSQFFTKPNNYVLPSCTRPVYLENSAEPNINYLHSAKALINTIEQFENVAAKSTTSLPVSNELLFLQQSTVTYGEKIAAFVKDGGLLTGQSIGNLYFSAEKLHLSAQWLKTNVHNDIPLKVNFMSRQNLVDTLAGLKKYHSDSPYIRLVEQQLQKTPEGQLQYVTHAPNETSHFVEAENCTSNNSLLYAARSGHSKYVYSVYRILYGLWHRSRYVLHSE